MSDGVKILGTFYLTEKSITFEKGSEFMKFGKREAIFLLKEMIDTLKIGVKQEKKGLIK